MSDCFEDRAVSPVIGGVLLIGIVMLVMAVLAAQILGLGLFTQQPRAELAYEEQSTDELLIGIEEATGLTAGETRLRLESGAECGTWKGSGDLESGDTMRLDTTDCSFTEGDVVQVIGSNVLLDTYQIQGVGLTIYHNCAIDGPLTSTSLADSNDVTIDNGETIKCDFTSPGEDRNFDIYSGSMLIGDISSSDGDFDLDNGTVDGYVEANGDDITVTGGSTITEFAYSDGNIDIDGGSTVEGPILATGTINADSSTIDGKIYHTGNVNPSSIQNTSHDGIVELDDKAELENKRDEFK